MERSRMSDRLALACALTIALGLSARAQGEAPGRILLHGPHAVGFTSSWQFDFGRTYRTAFDQGATYGSVKAARPILVNLWFPAEGARGDPMPHGAYLEIGAEGPVEGLARALTVHARGIFVQEVLGKAENELGADERVELQALLAAPTSCTRGAAPAPGRFPLVLFHSGAGSSFEDDAIFCEFLASHGYVVAGSAYLKADGSSLGVDGERGSAEDFQFLARHARGLPFVDADHVAVAGHSLGAQAALRYAAHPGALADALVLLDTTQDYYGLSIPLFESLVSEVSGGIEHLEAPLLVVAGPEAMFQLVDRLVQAERTYLTVPVLEHNDFIAQGLQRLAVLERLAARNPARASDAEVAGELQRAPRARALYAELCETVRCFLDAHLKGRPAALTQRIAPLLTTALGADESHVELVPRGTSEPAPYDPESVVPPTPRQLRRLVSEQGAAPACTVLERFRDVRPRSPIYSSSMLSGSLLHELYASGRVDEARLLYASVQRFLPSVLGLFEFLADMSQWTGHPERARPLLEMGLDLDPERSGLSERLRRLEAGETEGPPR